MRKSNIRKWFHLVIDFIPLFIIPVFIVYSGNKNGSFQQSIEIENKQLINFNQQRDYCTINSPASYLITNNDNISYTINGTTSGRLHLLSTNNIDLKANHKYLVNGIDNLVLHTSNWSFQSNGNSIITASQTYTAPLHLESLNATTYDNLVIYIMIYDLTQMYGVGNEPSFEQFVNEFENNYYPYTLSEKILITNGTITYDNTDIGSQFMYSLYTPIQKMFNFSELGGFKQFYQWISLNIFQGTAPIPFFIVFNIMIYNFLVDLIFLLYSVFMFFIDFAEHCMDNFMAKSQKGVK